MANGIEQNIAVKIKAIVDGLGDVQALALTVRSLNKTGGSNGLSRLGRDTIGVGSAAKITKGEVGDLAIGLGRLTEKAQKNGLGVFIKDLGTAARQLKDFQDLQKLDPFQGAHNVSLKSAGKSLAAAELQRNSLNHPTSALASGLQKHDPFQTAHNLPLAGAARELALFNAEAGKTKGAFAGIEFGTKTVTKSFLGMTASGSGASAILLSVASAGAVLVAALAAIGAGLAAFGFGAFVAEGVRFNAVIESARIGIASLIANTFDIKDATGNLLNPLQAFNAGLQQADDLERRLQKSAIETKYEFEDILQFFNSTLVAGAGLNATTEQLADLTNSLALAAGAINIPVEKVNTGIKQILTGYTTVRNDLAKAIFPGETTKSINDQLKKWRAQGTLIEEVNKKLLIYKLSADTVSQSFEAVASNAADAFKVFAADSTITIFNKIKEILAFIIGQIVDLKGETVKLTPTFEKIAEMCNDILGFIGDKILAAVKAVFEWITSWADYLYENKESLYEILKSVYSIAETLALMVGDTATIVSDTAQASTNTSGWVNVLHGAALVVGFIRDLVNIIVGALEVIIGLCSQGIGAALTGIGDIIQWLIDKTGGWLSSLSGVASLLNGIGNFFNGAGTSLVNNGLDRFVSGWDSKGLYGAMDTVNTPIPKIPKVDRPKTSTTPRKTGSGGDGGKKAAGQRAAKERLNAAQKLYDSIEKLQIANTEREVELAALANAAILKGWERRYDQGVVSAEDFYNKKKELELDDLKHQEDSLLKQQKFAREALARDLGALKGTFALSEPELVSLEQTLSALNPDNLKTASASVVKQAAEYTKYLEQDAQITQDLVKIELKRKDVSGDTTVEIEKQARITKRAMNDLAGEFAASTGNDGFGEFLKLQQKVSDEFPKILVETNKTLPGVKEFAAQIQKLGQVDADALPQLLADAGIEFKDLSDEARLFLKLMERLQGLSRIKSVTSAVSEIQAGLQDSVDAIRTKIADGSTNGKAGRAEILTKQASAVESLNTQLTELNAIIAGLEAKGVATDVERRVALGLSRAITATKGAGVFGDINDEVDLKKGEFDLRRAEAQRQFNQDKITENQLRDQTLQIENEEKIALQTLIAEMEKLPNLTLEQKAAIAALKGEVADLGVATDTFAVAINDQIAGGLSTFFDDLVDKPGEVLQSFGKMISGMLLGIAKVILQTVVLKAILSAIGIGSGTGGGGVGGFLSSLLGQAPKHAEGGILSGPGTGVSDSMLAAVSHGEGIIPANRVSQYGRNMIQGIIDGTFMPQFSIPGFASGTIIGAGGGSGSGSRGGIRIVNSLDPNMVKEFMSSAAGEEIILNVIGKNPGVVQRLT